MKQNLLKRGGKGVFPDFRRAQVPSPPRAHMWRLEDQTADDE